MDFSIKYIYNKLLAGSERTKVVKKNIFGSFGIKGLSIITSFILVPFTINLLDKEKYGIWITIFSVVNWFNIMDIGLGNGFRNKFAEAIAMDKKKLAKEYIQTLYSSMILITGGLVLLYFAISPFINWYYILNIPLKFDENMDLIAGLIFIFFCGQLIMKNISIILLSIQKTTLSNSLIFLGNLLALILIFAINKFYIANLLTISIIFMVSPIFVFLIATIVIFNNNLKEFKPKLFVIPLKNNFMELMNLGVKFFFINIAVIVMFASSSIIIAQLYGPAEVTTYNVGYQLFASTIAVFTIIITPFWTAFTEANVKKDYIWIKNSINKLIIIWLLFALGILLLWLVSPFVFRIWVGDKITISYHLSFQFALYAILMSLSSIFSYFVSGVGKISIILYIAIFQLIINIPFAIILAKYLNFNTTGIIMAININLLIGTILLILQTNKIINNKAHGIWNK